MSCDAKMYSLMSMAVSSDPELGDPLKFLDNIKNEEAEYRKDQLEIRRLYKYREVRDDTCYRYVAEDMLTNITDGRFEDFLKSKPDIIDMDEANMSLTRMRVKMVSKEIKKLNLHEIKHFSDSEYRDRLKVIIKQCSEKNYSNALDKCIDSMDRLKANFETIDIHEGLLKNSKRDLNFENKIERIITDIADINKFIEARKSINNLSQQENDIKMSPIAPSTTTPPTPTKLASVISGLLEKVESVTYVADSSRMSSL